MLGWDSFPPSVCGAGHWLDCECYRRWLDCDRLDCDRRRWINPWYLVGYHKFKPKSQYDMLSACKNWIIYIDSIVKPRHDQSVNYSLTSSCWPMVWLVELWLKLIEWLIGIMLGWSGLMSVSKTGKHWFRYILQMNWSVNEWLCNKVFEIHWNQLMGWTYRLLVGTNMLVDWLAWIGWLAVWVNSWRISWLVVQMNGWL